MWRSLMFVPILNERLLGGAAARGADALVLDLEAGVQPDRKQEARAALTGAVSGLRTASAYIAVRVNPLQSGGADDLAAAIEAGADLIVVPQATVASTRQAADLAGARPIIPLIETPRGVIDALAIAEAAPTVAGLGLGVEDYSTEMRAPPTPDLLLPAAFQVVQAARAAGCEPLLIPDTIADVRDLSRFEAAALKSRALGAGGCFAIHPGQVEVLNRVFMPSDQELLEARDIIALAEKISRSGGAIALHDQKMIDAPIVARARMVLAVGRRFKGASLSPPEAENKT